MEKIAFVFPGQGSQTPGMGKDLYHKFDVCKEIFDIAGDFIKELCFTASAETLNLTENAQPCLCVMESACVAALQKHNINAFGVAGFSLGEIPALACTGLMTISQVISFTRFRAECMRKCAEVHTGGMFALLKLSAEKVENICKQLDGVYIANYNCPGQIVVSCLQETFSDLINLTAANGGKAIKLAVSGAFHSPYMNVASQQINEYLQQESFGQMKIPLYSNVTANKYGNNPIDLLTRQVNSPVRWSDTIENMVADGFNTFIEIGPGKTLTGLIKKINSKVSAASYLEFLD